MTEYVTHSEFEQFSENVDQRFNKLETRFDSGFNILGAKIDKIQLGRQTSWPLIVSILGVGFTTILGFITLIITIGLLAISPLNTKITKHIEDPVHLQTSINKGNIKLVEIKLDLIDQHLRERMDLLDEIITIEHKSK